jgi:hypothetical protein
MRLSLGTGPLPRLLAPGEPDWLGADGVRVGWATRDRLFILRDDAVQLVELPDLVEEVCPTGARWTVALGSGFVRLDPATGRLEELLLDDEAEPLSTCAGADVGLFVEVPEHRLLRIQDGRALPLPAAALRARLIRPWSTGVGAVWVDDDIVVRLGARVGVVGRAPGADTLACGPEGALIVATHDDTIVAAPGQLARTVGEPLDAASARFAPDGGSALVAGSSGVSWLDLTTGAVRQAWTGAFLPVGFAPGPVLLDQDRGALVRGDGSVILDGFAVSRPSSAGGLLAGPGGALWCLTTGDRRAGGLFGGACATDGVHVVHVSDQEVHVLGGVRFAHHLCQDDDLVDTVRLRDDHLEITTLDGEVGRFTLDGTRIDRVFRRRVRRVTGTNAPPGVTLPREDEESVVLVGETRWPLPGDAAARVGDDVWVWTEQGALMAVPGGAPRPA